MESGSTSTPLDLHIRNKTDRYNLTIEAVQKLPHSIVDKEKAQIIIEKYQQKIKDHKEYILKVGDDPEEILNWKWQREVSYKVESHKVIK